MLNNVIPKKQRAQNCRNSKISKTQKSWENPPSLQRATPPFFWNGGEGFWQDFGIFKIFSWTLGGTFGYLGFLELPQFWAFLGGGFFGIPAVYALPKRGLIGFGLYFGGGGRLGGFSQDFWIWGIFFGTLF